MFLLLGNEMFMLTKMKLCVTADFTRAPLQSHAKETVKVKGRKHNVHDRFKRIFVPAPAGSSQTPSLCVLSMLCCLAILQALLL